MSSQIHFQRTQRLDCPDFQPELQLRARSLYQGSVMKALGMFSAGSSFDQHRYGRLGHARTAVGV
jgi:hypothetical protein